jgi:hypothetical protein
MSKDQIITDLQAKNDHLEGINIQLAEEIAGLAADLKQGHTCNTCLRDQLKNGEHPCEPLDVCKYGKKWDELQAQLATAHDSIKSLKDLIISGDSFISEEENATYILPSYKAWLKGMRAVIESEVK